MVPRGCRPQIHRLLGCTLRLLGCRVHPARIEREPWPSSNSQPTPKQCLLQMLPSSFTPSNRLRYRPTPSWDEVDEKPASVVRGHPFRDWALHSFTTPID